MRQWRPRLKEVNREMRQLGVTVPGAAEHVGLRARTLHLTGNWVVLTDCFNGFHDVKRTAVLSEAANCVPALTMFVTKCYGTKTAEVLYRMESGETRTIASSSDVQRGDPMGPAMFGLTLRPGLKCIREKFEVKGMEAFVSKDVVSLSLARITADMVSAFAFLRRALVDIIIVINLAKKIAVPRKGYAPTPEGILLVDSVDVRITGEGGATMLGVPIGMGEYVLSRPSNGSSEGWRNGPPSGLPR